MNFIVQIARNIKQIKENNMEREIKFLPARENYSIKMHFTRISRMGNGIESEVK